MALGFPSKRIRRKGSLLLLFLWFSIWAGYHLVSSLESPDPNWDREFAYRRIATASGILSYTSDEIPKWVKVLCLIESEHLLTEADLIFLAGKKHGEFPDAAAANWSLMFSIYGRSAKAKTLLEKTLKKDLRSETRKELELVSLFIEGETVPADLHQWALDQYMDVGGTWPIHHYFGKVVHDDSLNIWLNAISKRMIQRGLFARFLSYFIGLVAAVSIAFVLIGRRAIPDPVKGSPLPGWWDSKAVLSALFLALAASTLIVMMLYQIIPVIPQAYTAIALLSTLLFVVIPPAWMIYRFMPGLNASTKFFRFTGKKKFPFVWCFALGMSGALLMFSVGLVANLIGFESLRLSPEDWLRHGMLDLPVQMLGQIFLGACVVPFAEEIVFRGFLFRGFSDKIGVYAAAIGSSIVFATVHWYTPAGWILVFVDGLIFCYLYRRTGSLWPPVIAHGVLNFVLLSSTTSWFSLW